MTPTQQLLVSLGLRIIGVLILCHVLLLYVPVTPTWLAVVVVISAAALLLAPAKLLPLAISFAATTAVLEVLVRLGLGGVTPYFRPHERLALDTTYRANERVEMTVPHGDLLTIDPTLDKQLATPRREVFVTDSHGNRNDQNYNGERLILIGDSFLVGTETTLAQVLRRDHGVEAYNLSFSSIGPLIYADKVLWARRALRSDACVALFFFEGNDFQLVDPVELERRRAVPRGLQLAVKSYVLAVRRESEWSKTFFGLATRAAARFSPSDQSSQLDAAPRAITFAGTVGGRQMAFLRGYADVVRRTSFDDHGFVRSQLALAPPDMVFFIPDKYRVYAPLLDTDPVSALPHVQWEYLKRATDELDIPAIDLTQPMIERSRALAASGETTFWPDDTHWNRIGESVAAEVLQTTLSASTSGRCSVASTRAAAPTQPVAGR